jgi:hypothetical protein
MKLFCAGKLLNKVEDHEYDLLFGATIKISGRGHIKRDNWGTGWIFEADESFRSWCVIAYGFDPAPITDGEYSLLVSDSVAYLSKERTLELRKPVIAQLSLIAINS